MFRNACALSLLIVFAGVNPLPAANVQESANSADGTGAGAYDENQESSGPDSHNTGAFEPSELIMHHIADANEFHIVGDLTLPLPCILFNRETGAWSFFMSNRLYNRQHEPAEYDGYRMDHGRIKRTDDAAFLDLSITKNVFGMLMAALLMSVIFLGIARSYVSREGKAPKGMQSFLEPLILFIRDDIVRPNIGPKYERYMPYLLTVFFFIWINNMLGLVPFFPGSANVTGNITVTMTLAVFTLIVTSVSGNKQYWQHVLWMPGVPAPVKLILTPIELVGLITKPFALMIRLFANITAGHIIILSLASLIFVFGKGGQSLGGGLGGSALAVPFMLFMNVLELFVAFLQAFIFTILSALFIGQAVEEHH